MSIFLVLIHVFNSSNICSSDSSGVFSFTLFSIRLLKTSNWWAHFVQCFSFCVGKIETKRCCCCLYSATHSYYPFAEFSTNTDARADESIADECCETGSEHMRFCEFIVIEFWRLSSFKWFSFIYISLERFPVRDHRHQQRANSCRLIDTNIFLALHSEWIAMDMDTVNYRWARVSSQWLSAAVQCTKQTKNGHGLGWNVCFLLFSFFLFWSFHFAKKLKQKHVLCGRRHVNDKSFVGRFGSDNVELSCRRCFTYVSMK